MKFKNIAFTAADLKEAQLAHQRLCDRYDHVPAEKADIIIALGGDGFMLQTLHRYMKQGTPIYGLNRGSVGFLMNVYNEEDLPQRLSKAQPINLYPLRMTAFDFHGKEHKALAINDISLLRQTHLAAKISIRVDGVERLEGMVCDGVLVSTPAGSTAYNLSVQGPIVPLGANLLALTPISAFRPRQWRGALLPDAAVVTFDILDPQIRTVSAVADFTEVRDVKQVVVREDRGITPTLLFDPEHNLEERIIKEQFLP
jgi:NAD+ kinase